MVLKFNVMAMEN